MRTKTAMFCTVLVLSTLVAGAGEPPERFRGWVASIGGPAAMSGQRTWVRLHVDEYTSDEKVMELAGILAEQGEDALLKAVEKMPAAGWIVLGANTRYDLKVIRSVGTDEARYVRFLTDRPIQFAEMWNATRSRDYRFGLVELVVDQENKGEGTIIPTAQIRFRDGKVEITSLGIQPFRILQVGPEKFKDKSKAEEDPKE